MADVPYPCNGARNREHDIKPDKNNEPIVEMVELDKNGAASHGEAGEDMGWKNKSERFASRNLTAAPPPNGPKQQTARIEHNSQRHKQEACQCFTHWWQTKVAAQLFNSISPVRTGRGRCNRFSPPGDQALPSLDWQSGAESD